MLQRDDPDAMRSNFEAWRVLFRSSACGRYVLERPAVRDAPGQCQHVFVDRLGAVRLNLLQRHAQLLIGTGNGVVLPRLKVGLSACHADTAEGEAEQSRFGRGELDIRAADGLDAPDAA